MTVQRPIISELTIATTATATVTGDWFSLDYKTGDSQDRAFYITQSATSAGTVQLQVAASVPETGSDTLDTAYTVSSYTASAQDGVLTGNWPAVRVVGIGSGPGSIKFVMMG